MKYILLLSFFTLSFFQPNKEKQTQCYIFIAEECPISIYMAKPLQQAMKDFGEQVQFYAVFPKSNSTEQTAQRFLDTYHLQGMQILLDTDQAFAKKTGATITPEAIVTDTEGIILYRGRISDAYAAPGRMKHGPRNNELTTVLTSLGKGEKVAEPWPSAVGCFITFH
jgi:hypothetical protein